MLFGLTSPEMILSKTGGGFLPGRTLKIEYINTYRTCGMCGAAMRTRQELPALFLCGSVYEGILKSGIEVKAVSDKCLAKSVAVTWGNEAYL